MGIRSGINLVDLPVNPLNKLKLDIWYKVLIPIGAIILLFAIFTSNKELMLLGFGFLLIGLGEWKNTKWIMKEQLASISGPYRSWQQAIRKPDALGNLLNILGVLALIAWGLGFFEIYHVVQN